MTEIKTSQAMQNLAEEAFRAGQPTKDTDTFAIYPLPKKPDELMGNYVLLLFKPGHDWNKEKIPDGIITPVEIGNRQGYLLDKDLADNYRP